MASPHLQIADVSAAQNQKETTINSQTAALDRATQQHTDITVTGDFTLTSAQQRENAVLVLGGTPAGAFVIDMFDTNEKVLSFVNESGQTATLNNSAGAAGATTVTVADGAATTVHYDGTDFREIGGGGGGGGTGEQSAAGFVGGAVPTNTIVLRYLAERNLTLFPSAGANGSVGHVGTTDGTQRDYDVQVNGVSKGTMRFAASGSTASFVSLTAQAVVSGDRVDVVSPAAVGTQADLSFNIVFDVG